MKTYCRPSKNCGNRSSSNNYHLNFPLQEFITNWIDELLGLAAAEVLVSSWQNKVLHPVSLQVVGMYVQTDSKHFFIFTQCFFFKLQRNVCCAPPLNDYNYIHFACCHASFDTARNWPRQKAKILQLSEATLHKLKILCPDERLRPPLNCVLLCLVVSV